MNVKVEVESQEPWRRILSIEVTAEDAEREYERVARKVAKRVRLPGFRKGKVPVTVVRKSFKAELDQEFIETVVPKAFGAALDETGIDPVTEPKFEELSFGEERPLSFKADFEARPELDPTGYEGMAAEKQIPEVEEEQIDRVLEDFRKGRATLEVVDREAIAGDVVLVDYHPLDANEEPIEGRGVKDSVIELGANQVIDEFENALTGAREGGSPVAEISYPEDHQDELLAGTTVRYRIKVRKVQEKRFPSLTDELVAEHTDLKTIEELRARVREELAREADRFATQQLERSLLERVVDANPFDPPVALVDRLLDDFVEQHKREAQYQGQEADSMDEEALRQQNRTGAERQVRRMLMLDALAGKGEIRVTDSEIRERIRGMASVQGVTPKKLIESLGGDRFLRRLSREIRDKKVLAFLVGNAEITEKQVSVERAPEAT